MKKYYVNVHYDAVVSLKVKAETEDDALTLVKEEAENMPIDDYFFEDACITSIENIEKE